MQTRFDQLHSLHFVIVYVYLSICLTGIIQANPILINKHLSSELPVYLRRHFAEKHHQFPPKLMNEAVQSMLLKHYRLEHGGGLDGTYSKNHESDVAESFQVKSSNRDIEGESAPEKQPDFDVDTEWNRADRNYYGWMDFRKRASSDHDDYLY